jgi:hypothetical protein
MYLFLFAILTFQLHTLRMGSSSISSNTFMAVVPQLKFLVKLDLAKAECLDNFEMLMNLPVLVPCIRKLRYPTASSSAVVIFSGNETLAFTEKQRVTGVGMPVSILERTPVSVFSVSSHISSTKRS